MTKIDEMLSQIAKGRARNLAALLGCFVGTKSESQVVRVTRRRLTSTR